MKKTYISEAVIRRLPRYYRYLHQLSNIGYERISSASLGQKMNITASQIRQDLACFGEFGQQGYGYSIDLLKDEIGKILGINKLHHAILVGNGHLAHALINNFDFISNGVILDAAFDVNSDLIGKKINEILTLPMENLENYIEQNEIEIAILTVPSYTAQSCADKLVSYSIKGIWNFTNVELQVPPETKVENVHFADSLLTLSYRITDHNGKD